MNESSEVKISKQVFLAIQNGHRDCWKGRTHRMAPIPHDLQPHFTPRTYKDEVVKPVHSFLFGDEPPGVSKQLDEAAREQGAIADTAAKLRQIFDSAREGAVGVIAHEKPHVKEARGRHITNYLQAVGHSLASSPSAELAATFSDCKIPEGRIGGRVR